MVGPDARRLWKQAASDPFSSLGPFRLALDAPFQSPGLVRKREFSDPDMTVKKWYMEALASFGGGPRFLHAKWTLYECC